MHRSRSSNIVILFLGDLMVMGGALVVALAARYGEWPSEAIINEHLAPFVTLFLLWSVVFFISGLYDTHTSLHRKNIPALLIKVQIINLFLAVAFFFALPIGITPKTTLALYLVVSTLLLAAWRLFIFPLIVTSTPLRAVIIGSGDEARALVNVLDNNPYYKFISADIIDLDIYTDIDTRQAELLSYVKERDINLVIGDMRDKHGSSLTQLYYNLTYLNQDVRFVGIHALYEQLCHRIPPSLVNEGWMLEHELGSSRSLYGFLKRSIDIIGSIILGVLTLPFYPFVILTIKRHDNGPAFIWQERVGQFNKPVRIIKFRTMTGLDSSDSALKSTLTVTKVGKVLRKTRLDELPQLWNVLKGDLSFIGPRPEIPSLAAIYAEEIPYYNMRHLIKPGLSGWAQINNYDVPRGGVDIERTIEKLSFDLFYLKHRSFLFDIEIVLKTIATILSRSGT